MAGNITAKEEKMMKTLLILDSLRGLDSTGVASVGVDNVLLAKSVGDPFQLFETRNFLEILKRRNFVLLGHNRAATVGKVTRANAHPFDFDTLVGAQNGTLTNKWELPSGNKYDTDTEALFHEIEEKGVKEAISKAKGAWALTWYNKEENTINFLRNKERPFNFAFSEDGKTIFWASELWMLQTAAAREDIKLKQPWVSNEDKHIAYVVPKNGEVFGKEEVQTVEGAPFHKITYLPKSHKSNQDTTQTSSSAGVDGINKNLLPGQKLTFKCIGFAFDRNKNKYLSLINFDNFKEDFRCYIGNEDPTHHLDKKFSGIITKVTFQDNKFYYKVSRNSLTEEDEEVSTPPKSSSKMHTKVQSDGVIIHREEWEKQTHECCVCGSPIEFDEDFISLRGDNEVCSVCGEDQATLQYLGVC